MECALHALGFAAGCDCLGTRERRQFLIRTHARKQLFGLAEQTRRGSNLDARGIERALHP